MKPPNEKAGGPITPASLNTESSANLAVMPPSFKPSAAGSAPSRSDLAERACQRWALKILADVEDLRAFRSARRAEQ